MKEKRSSTFEFLNKDKKISIRLSTDLYEKIKDFSKNQSKPTQKCIREAIELYLGNKK